MNKPFALIVFLFFSINLMAQVSFEDAGEMAALDEILTPLNAGFADLNGDFKDDLVRIDRGNRISVDYQSGKGKPFIPQMIANMGSGTQWTLCIGDINNDGLNEIMAGGAYDGAKVYSRLIDDFDYELVYSSSSNFFAQGSNFADIDNDGWLDMFICDDDGESEIWINDQNGDLIPTAFIDMKTTPASDNSGNYGSEWVDFDSDGDLDLYIAKCRQGVQDSTDPRRINALFRNDGNNNYTEVAAEYGLAVGDQSWTVNFGDIDNDGDMDCLLANHNTIHGLYENIENDTFINISVAAGIDLEGFALQGFLRDLDNDGFLDIIISGGNDHVFMNNGDHTFTKNENPFGQWDSHSVAFGDANNDGFLDAYVNYGTGIVEIGSRSDALWINSGNDNSYLNVSLKGQSSNSSGVGARLEAYGEWGVQIRDSRAGEGYGIVNSFNMHFGLGTATKVDSLIIKWPSGTIDKFYDLDASQSFLVIENQCLSPFVDIIPSGGTDLCEGETIELQAPNGDSYQWSTGENTQTITVSEAGAYHVTVFDGTGCFAVSNPVGITREPDEKPIVLAEGDERPCIGTSVILTSSEAEGYMWSNGEISQVIEVTENGSYSVTIQGACKEWTSDAIEVSFLDPVLPIGMNDTIFEEGLTATLSAEGVNISWYEAVEGGDPLETGSTFETPALTETTVYYAQNDDVFIGDVNNTGIESHQGGSLSSGDQFNGGLIFDVHENIMVKSMKLTTDTPGPRVIEIFKSDNQLIYRDTFELVVGENKIDLNADLFPGLDYRITTNEDFNNEQYGFNGPRLTRDDTNVNFPYEIEGKISLTNSFFGLIFYYYFYDWEIVGDDKICISERVPVTAVVDFGSGVGELPEDLGISIFPNPMTDQLYIKSDNGLKASIQLYSSIGSKLIDFDLIQSNKTIDVSDLVAGPYYLIIKSEGKIYHQKMIKI
jgi:hypothetical protein